MNKKLFLDELHRLLSDLPPEERNQAIKYYEDYFEDAGPENEQAILKELGSPQELANQIKATTQDDIEYGQGSSFHRSTAYPEFYAQKEPSDSQNENNSAFKQTKDGFQQGHQQAGNGFNNNGYRQTDNGFNNNNNNYQQATTGYNSHYQQQSARKAVWIVLFALLAITIGLPCLSVLFGILLTIFSVIISIVLALFGTGGGLMIGGIASFFGSFFMTTTSGIGAILFAMGIGLVLFAIGALILWVGVLFCIRFLPALFSGNLEICKKCNPKISTMDKKEVVVL